MDTPDKEEKAKTNFPLTNSASAHSCSGLVVVVEFISAISALLAVFTLQLLTLPLVASGDAFTVFHHPLYSP